MLGGQEAFSRTRDERMDYLDRLVGKGYWSTATCSSSTCAVRRRPGTGSRKHGVSSGPLAISVVSLTEIPGGMRSPERREVMRLLSSMQRFEVTEQVAWRAATLMREYRRSHSGIGLGEYLIAATALTEGLELATLNVRPYLMFPGLKRPF